jgi:hypothetical protein
MDVAFMAPKPHVDTTDVTKTQDICPEFPLSTTPEELSGEFIDLNNQITAKLVTLKSKTDEVNQAFEAMLPELDRMNAMLSQRGPLRKLMDKAGMPSWTAWFADFEKRSPIPTSYKKVQRALRERRGTVSSEPDFNVIAKGLIRDLESTKRKEKLEAVAWNLDRLNPTIWKKLISALKNAAVEVASFEKRISEGFEELPENGKCHQRLVRESRAKLPDPLLDEKKALAADLKTNGTVRQIGYAEARGLILGNEYLGTTGAAEFYFGLYIGPYLASVVGLGSTAGSNVAASVCGPVHADKVITLVRGATEDWADQPVVSNGKVHTGAAASYLIAEACDQMTKKDFNVFVAYSDPLGNEVGAIYSALNFQYCGMPVSKHEMIRTPDGKERDERYVSSLAKQQGRTFSEQKQLMREQGCTFFKANSKHRWVGFYGDRRTVRALKKALLWDEFPPPKRQQICDTSKVTAAGPPQPARFDPSVSLQDSIVREPWQTNQQQVGSEVDGIS